MFALGYAAGCVYRVRGGGLLGGINNPNRKLSRLRLVFGPFWVLCWATVGPCGVYVGPVLGSLVSHMGFNEWRSGREKQPPRPWPYRSLNVS